MSLEYQAVGFGSHHWLATDAGGGRVFAMVDDLTAKLRTRRTRPTPHSAGSGAFATALSLRADAGLGFVVAPVPASDGRALARLSGRYSLAVYLSPGSTAARTASSPGPATAGQSWTCWSGSTTPACAPRADDFVVPHLDVLRR